MTTRAVGIPGRPFEAILNSADADPALALVLYEPGTTTVITLDLTEYLNGSTVDRLNARVD